MYIMECERCHAENYDEAYYCKNCGAKLDKPRNSTHTTQRSNFPYDYQQQPDNSRYQNNHQQQSDNYNYPNNYQQQYDNSRYQNNYQQQYDNSRYQNNYQQQPDNYQYQNNQQHHNAYNNIPNNTQSHTEKTVYVFKEKSSPNFGIFGGSKKKSYDKKIQQMLDEALSAEQSRNTSYNSSTTSINGGIRKEHTTHTSYVGGTKIHTDKTVYTVPISSNGMDKDNDIHQMYEKAKKILENPQQYNEQYNSSYNNSSYNPSQNPAYNYSYPKPNRVRRVSKGKLRAITFIFIVIISSVLILCFNYKNLSEESVRNAVANHLAKSNDKYESYFIQSLDEPYITINFLGPEEYIFSSYSGSDMNTVTLENQSEISPDVFGEIKITTFKGNIEDDLDDMLGFNFQIISDETIQSSAGEMRLITISNPIKKNHHLAYMNLENNQVFKICSYDNLRTDEYDQELKDMIRKMAESCSISENAETGTENETEQKTETKTE